MLSGLFGQNHVRIFYERIRLYQLNEEHFFDSK